MKNILGNIEQIYKAQLYEKDYRGVLLTIHWENSLLVDLDTYIRLIYILYQKKKNNDAPWRSYLIVMEFRMKRDLY